MISIRVFAVENLTSSVFDCLTKYAFDKQVPVSPISETENVPAPVRIVVDENGISVLPDWFNTSLPVLMPTAIAFTEANLMALIMFYSGLNEDALNVSRGTKLYELIDSLLQAEVREPSLEQYYSGYELLHNQAVLDFYLGSYSGRYAAALFQNALGESGNLEQQAYTAWHYSMFLQDHDYFKRAIDLLEGYIVNKDISELARKALQLELLRCQKELNHGDWNEATLKAYKDLTWQVYTYYRDLHAPLQEAQLCREMAALAQEEENYAEALSYINKCLHIYLAEQLIEMEADAEIFKGTLLHQWAKSGAPQFYQQAIKSFQRALHVFKKEAVPHIFAHIHHQLGVVYAEMPDDNKKRAIWAAVSATSFKEALEYYNTTSHPYDHAMVCHNYATALIKYPEAIRSDNMAKAIDLFEQALKIRTVDMPYERCVTLLNYLEACWEADNVNQQIEKVRIVDMQKKVLEAMSLAPTEELKVRAQEHFQQINKVLQLATA